MKQAKFFSLIVAIAIFLYGIIGYYYLPQASFEGSLTRMAMLPESEFGWTKEQPVIDPALMLSSNWEDADILVIGDSFSNAQIWQTVFIRRGIKIRTETWESIGNNICKDFSHWSRTMGFKGKHIIIESVEAYFEKRLNKSIDCTTTRYHQLTSTHVSPPAPQIDRHIRNLSGQLSVGIQTRLHLLKYENTSKESNFRSWDLTNEVMMERLSNGCDLFSHPKCNDVLFYKQDHIGDFDDLVLTHMEIINARLTGLTTTWVVIPDKTTVYLHPEKKFWDSAEKQFNSPNILKIFRKALEDKTVDLYKGNDTHTSTSGYLILGNLMLQNFHQSLGQ